MRLHLLAVLAVLPVAACADADGKYRYGSGGRGSTDWGLVASGLGMVAASQPTSLQPYPQTSSGAVPATCRSFRQGVFVTTNCW